MMSEQTSWLPDHRTIVTVDNADMVRPRLPEDQREHVIVGCSTWRCPADVDTWLEPCGSTLSHWPDGLGAVHHDGELGGSSWGAWRNGELQLNEGLAVDVSGRILHVWLGLGSIETHDRDP